MSALPRTSPWGRVQRCEELTDGVFLVDSTDLGGIMVRQKAAGFLSADALKCGFKANNSYCFESDYCEPVVIRELLDKNLWTMPARITDKAGYEENINRALRQWQPEYWESRQKTLAAQTGHTETAEPEMVDVRKDIIFRDRDYKEKFRIKDGDSIKITVAYDGEELIRKCRWIDETHMYVGSSCFHTDEFMGRQTKAGNTYEPLPNPAPTLDILIGEPGKPPRDTEIAMTVAAMREAVGGLPEIIQADKKSAIVKGANGNGTVLICGMNGGFLTSLHPYDAQIKKRELKEYETTLAEIVKPTLADRLESGKAKAAAQEKAAPKPRHKEVGG